MIIPSTKLMLALGYDVDILEQRGSELLVKSKQTKPNQGMSLEQLNIYELMHLMKEWAWNTHKQVVSSMIDERSTRTPNEKTQWYSSSTSYYEQALDGMYADTEFEAVTAACEWILKGNNMKHERYLVSLADGSLVLDEDWGPNISQSDDYKFINLNQGINTVEAQDGHIETWQIDQYGCVWQLDSETLEK